MSQMGCAGDVQAHPGDGLAVGRDVHHLEGRGDVVRVGQAGGDAASAAAPVSLTTVTSAVTSAQPSVRASVWAKTPQGAMRSRGPVSSSTGR